MISERLFQPNHFRRRVGWLKWLAPGVMLALVVFYQIGPARWIHNALGESYHYWAEILFYGLLGPALAYLVLELLERWWEERETSDLQARIVSQRLSDLAESRQLNDDALQALFAASMVIASLDRNGDQKASLDKSQIQATKQSIELAMQQLQARLAELTRV